VRDGGGGRATGGGRDSATADDAETLAFISNGPFLSASDCSVHRAVITAGKVPTSSGHVTTHHFP